MIGFHPSKLRRCFCDSQATQPATSPAQAPAIPKKFPLRHVT